MTDFGQMIVGPSDPDWATLTARQEPPPPEFSPASPATDNGGVPLPVEGLGIAGTAGAGAVAGAFVGGPVGAVVGGLLGGSAAAIAGAGPKVGGAALRRYNPVASAINYLATPTFPPDPSYDVSQDKDITAPNSKYGPYLDQFVDSQSKPQTQSIMSRIDGDLQDEKTLSDAGIMGTLASLAAGNLSPLTLLPVGGLFGEAANVGRVALGLRGVAEGAVIAGGLTAANEAVLQATHPTQTTQESIFNTLTAAALGGILGGAAGAADIGRLTRGVTEDIGGAEPRATSEAAPEAALPPVEATDTGLAALSPVHDPLTSITLNARLAANGVAEADRPDFVTAYSRIADEYNSSLAELESIRVEKGQPQTAPEYQAEVGRITQARDAAMTELDSILKDYGEPAEALPVEELPSIETPETMTAATNATAGGENPHIVPEAIATRTAATAPIGETTAAAEPTEAASAVAAERGTSKIGKSVEQKAVDARLTNGFEGTAGYDKINIKDQAARATNLITSDLEKARAVVRGEQPLPEGLKGTALITAMEEHIKANPNPEMAYELANSPLVTATSEAAQELRLAAERDPDSVTAKLQQIKDALLKKAGGPKQAAAERAKIVKSIKAETSKVNLSKDDLSWQKFLSSIEC